ncbi:MAG: hypothetical protein IPI34_05610 [bacterium]|nr:hypothetical protein [bacterium]
MRRTIALAMILSLVAVTGVEAQISQCQDVFSVYFDTGATAYNVTYPGGFAPINVYLMITRPSGAFVRAWECTIVETNNFTVQGTWTLNGGLDVDGDAMDFVVGMGTTPHPAAPAVILASKTMYGAAPGASSAATFTVKGVAGSVSFPGGEPGYVHTLGINTPCQVLTGNMNAPQACERGVHDSGHELWRRRRLLGGDRRGCRRLPRPEQRGRYVSVRHGRVRSGARHPRAAAPAFGICAVDLPAPGMDVSVRRCVPHRHQVAFRP